MSQSSGNPTNQGPDSTSNRLQDSISSEGEALHPWMKDLRGLHKSDMSGVEHEQKRAASEDQPTSATMTTTGGMGQLPTSLKPQQNTQPHQEDSGDVQQQQTSHPEIPQADSCPFPSMVSDRPLAYENVKTGTDDEEIILLSNDEEPPSGSHEEAGQDEDDRSLSLKVEDVVFDEELEEGVLISAPEEAVGRPFPDDEMLQNPPEVKNEEPVAVKTETVKEAIDTIVALAPQHNPAETEGVRVEKTEEPFVSEEAFMSQINESAFVDEVSSIASDKEDGPESGAANSEADAEFFGQNLPPLQSPEAEELIQSNSTKIFDTLDSFVMKGESATENNAETDNKEIEESTSDLHTQSVADEEEDEESQHFQEEEEEEDPEGEETKEERRPRESLLLLLFLLAFCVLVVPRIFQAHRSPKSPVIADLLGLSDDPPLGPDDVHLENAGRNATDDVYLSTHDDTKAQFEGRTADTGFSEIPFWEINVNKFQSTAVTLMDSASQESHIFQEWLFLLEERFQQLWLALQQLSIILGLAVLLVAGLRWKIHKSFHSSPSEKTWGNTVSPLVNTSEPAQCDCRCLVTLTKFENLLNFHKTFKSCGTGRLSHTITEWGQSYPSPYHKLTMKELQMLIVGLCPMIAAPKNIHALSKGARVARVYKSYEQVLLTLTVTQIRQLLEIKHVTVKKTASKKELVSAALKAGF